MQRFLFMRAMAHFKVERALRKLVPYMVTSALLDFMEHDKGDWCGNLGWSRGKPGGGQDCVGYDRDRKEGL